MHSAITQCSAECFVQENRTRSDTHSSFDSLLSNEDQHSDRKSFSSEETDPGYVEANSVVADEIADVFIDEQKKCKIIQLAEFYLSDEQVLKDVFLLKHVKRNKEGYISLKLLSSFKKMKSATKDWREVAVALRESDKLEVNESGSKVRRRDPLPEHDETCSSRVVLAFNLPFEKPTVANLMEQFSKVGDILSVRIVNPGSISADIKKYKIKHKALGTTVCAIIEYDSYEAAAKCAKAMTSSIENNWRQIQVIHVAASKATEVNQKTESTPKRKRIRPKNKTRVSESSGGYSTSPSLSSSDIDQPHTPKSIPKTQKTRHVKSNSYSDTKQVTFTEFGLANKLQKKLNSKAPINGRRHSEGNVLLDNASRERRRAASLCIPMKSAVQIIRNPLGPDGTNGFRLQRMPIAAC